jgi:hypothetical protein
VGIRILDRVDVSEALDRVVRELGGDFKYYSNAGVCYYLPDERNPKGCIVGATLSELGLEEALPDDVLSGAQLFRDLESDGVNITTGARIGLAAAQAVQDQGHTWAEAKAAFYAAADAYESITYDEKTS